MGQTLEFYAKEENPRRRETKEAGAGGGGDCGIIESSKKSEIEKNGCISFL